MKNPFRWLWELICYPFEVSKKNRRIKRLAYALSKLQDPANMPNDTERAITAETITWLIRYYKGDADAHAEGTPEIKLNKILRTPVAQFSNIEVIRARVLSHWIQYEHIDGF